MKWRLRWDNDQSVMDRPCTMTVSEASKRLTLAYVKGRSMPLKKFRRSDASDKNEWNPMRGNTYRRRYSTVETKQLRFEIELVII